MKLKFEHFEGLSCLTVRDTVTAEQLRLFIVGLDSIAKTLDQTLVINMMLAHHDATVTNVLSQTKKKFSTHAQKIFWVGKEKPLADFQNIDLFVSRTPGSKMRQIAEKIKLDDEIYALTEKLKNLENREKEVEASGFDTHNLILENQIMKEQKRILDECIVWHEQRMGLQKPVLIDNETSASEIAAQTKELVKSLKESLKQEVDL